LENKIRCKRCGEILISETRNDIKICKCGKVGIDGGLSYIRRIGKKSDRIELSIFVEDEEK
jgi:hypothetical protein